MRGRDLLLLVMLGFFGLVLLDRAIYIGERKAKARRVDRIISVVENLVR